MASFSAQGLSICCKGITSGCSKGIFDCLAAGTFLHIAILEMIDKEFSAKMGSGLKFVMLCMGLGLMAVIALWT